MKRQRAWTIIHDDEPRGLSTRSSKGAFASFYRDKQQALRHAKRLRKIYPGRIMVARALEDPKYIQGAGGTHLRRRLARRRKVAHHRNR